MEFLDIILAKVTSLLLHAIHSPLLLADFKENPYSPQVLKSLQKIRETRKIESSHE
jgi:hypothetical protein